MPRKAAFVLYIRTLAPAALTCAASSDAADASPPAILAMISAEAMASGTTNRDTPRAIEN